MSFINKFFGTILAAFNSFTGHYLLALLLFALMIKVLLLPFGIKQQKTSIKQARVRPKEMAIRNKYRGRTDQPTMQKMNAEIQELYQKEGYNVAGGCLPMIIQLVVVFILYGIVYSPLTYICGYSSEMITKIGEFAVQNLGAAAKDGVFSGRELDLMKYLTAENLPALNEFLGSVGQVVEANLPNFQLFGQSLAVNPSWSSWLVLIPLLNFAFTILSMLVSRKLTFQPMQSGGTKQMLITSVLMSLMTLWFAFNFPAVLGIYWIFNTLLGMLQQFILAKTIPLPQFTEEDYKQAEREYLGKSAKKEQIERTKAALARPLADDECADLGEYHSVYDEKPETNEVSAPSTLNGVAIKKAPLKKKK